MDVSLEGVGRGARGYRNSPFNTTYIIMLVIMIVTNYTVLYVISNVFFRLNQCKFPVWEGFSNAVIRQGHPKP